SSVAVDAFHIELKDTINNGIPAAFILTDPVKYASFITRGAPTPDFPGLPGPITNIDQTNLNTGKTKITGLDLDGKIAFRTGYGRWTLSGQGTYYWTYDTENPDGTFSNAIDQVNSNTGGVIPRWKHRLALDWVSGPWTVVFAQNFQKSYYDLPGTF